MLCVREHSCTAVCSAWVIWADSLFYCIPDSQDETPEKRLRSMRRKLAAGRAVLGGGENSERLQGVG